MSGFNQCQFIGNLGADPEVRRTQAGKMIVNLRLAVSEKWRDANGERQERTEWVPVVIFAEGLCKVAESYLRKGSKIMISGKFQTRKWQDQSGQDRYSTEIVLQGFNSTLVMLDGPSGQSREDQPSQSRSEPQGYGGGSGPMDDSEIPF